MPGDLRVLRVITKLLLPFILLFALYIQFHGEYSPGGGFQAGVMFAAGLVLYTLVFGLEAARRAVPPLVLNWILSLGVLLYAGVGVVTLLGGGDYLDYNALNSANPVAGQQAGILLVELGVGLTVASAMILLFYGFAGRGVDR
jgi:multicomponent Na+:H+ antiporter subunit B